MAWPHFEYRALICERIRTSRMSSKGGGGLVFTPSTSPRPPRSGHERAPALKPDDVASLSTTMTTQPPVGVSNRDCRERRCAEWTGG